MIKYNQHSVHENWDAFKQHISTIMKKHNGNQLPGLKPQLKKLIKKKNQLYYKARATKSQDDWDRFKHAESVVQKQLRRSEWDYVNTMLKEGMFKKYNKQLWKYVESR